MKQENSMIDALKTLFENDVVSEDIRAQIEEAWEGKIKANKMQNFVKNLLKNMSMTRVKWLSPLILCLVSDFKQKFLSLQMTANN
jgi:hypothetical protein